MIKSLVDDLDNSIEYGNTVLYVDMTFDNILVFIEMLRDQELSNVEKIFLGLEILVENYETIEDEPLDQQIELFNYILDEFLDVDKEKESSDSQDGNKIMDFVKDADLIYASFLFDYGIDLFEMRGELDWRRFVALLRNLSDETPFKTAVKYRTMKIPSAKKYGQEYRDHVMRMKQFYSLEDKFDADQMLDAIADIFRRG